MYRLIFTLLQLKAEFWNITDNLISRVSHCLHCLNNMWQIFSTKTFYIQTFCIHLFIYKHFIYKYFVYIYLYTSILYTSIYIQAFYIQAVCIHLFIYKHFIIFIYKQFVYIYLYADSMHYTLYTLHSIPYIRTQAKHNRLPGNHNFSVPTFFTGNIKGQLFDRNLLPCNHLSQPFAIATQPFA